MYTYDVLKGGSKPRLAAKKAYAEKMQKVWPGKTWRDFDYIASVKGSTKTHWSRAIGGSFKGALNADSFQFCGFDYIGEAHRLAGLRYTGWYCDSFENETIRGHVVAYRKPHRLLPAGTESRQVFCPAVDWSESDGVTVWPLETYIDREEAARAADDYAQSIAYNEREYREADSEKYAADEALAEAIDAIKTARAQFATLHSDYKKSQLTGAVCELLREKMRTLRDTVRDTVGELPGLRDKLTEATEWLDRIEKREAANYPAREA